MSTPVTSQVPAPALLRPGKAAVVTAALLFGCIAYAIPSNMLVPLLVSLEAQYHISADEALWISLVPLLAGACFVPTLCRLSDTMGWKKQIAITSLACLLVGAVVDALSSDLTLLLIGRVFTGVGAAVFPASLSIINDRFALTQRKIAATLNGACLFLGLGIGGLSAALLVEHHVSFRAVFWVSAALAALGLAAVALFAVNGNGPAPDAPAKWWQAIDSLGVAGFAVPAIALDIAFNDESQWGWGSWEVISLITLAVLVFVAWIAIERRLPSPLVDQKVFWSRPVWVGNAVALLTGFGSIGAALGASTIAQMPPLPGLGGLGLGPVSGAWVVIPVEWGGLLVASLVGVLSRKVGKGPFLFAGALIESVGLWLLVSHHSSITQLVICMVVVGLGAGLAISSFTLIYVEDVPPEHVSRMYAIASILASGVGGSIGGAVFGAYIANNPLKLPPTVHLPRAVPSAQAFTGYWQLAAILTLLGAAISLIYAVSYWSGLRGGDRAMVPRQRQGEPAAVEAGS